MQSSELADRFIAALSDLESARSIQPIIDLFADNAVLYNPIDIDGMRGSRAVRAFWQNYIDTFADVKTQFNRRVLQDGLIVLEWLSSGHLANSKLAIQYAGVTILQHDGNKIQKFNTYYDTARLSQISSSAALQRRPEMGPWHFEDHIPPDVGTGD